MMTSLLNMLFRPRVLLARLPKRFLVYLFGGLVAGFVSPAAAVEPVRFQLRATAQADSTGVYLNQVIDTRDALPSVRLCDSPAFGKAATLTREQVAGYLREAGAELVISNWAGPEMVRITRRIRTLTEADMLNLLTETLQRDCVKDRGELELRPTRGWAEVPVPDEPLTLRILEQPTGGIAPAALYRFEIRSAREGVGIWQTAVQVRIWRDIWVAHSAVKRGEPLSDADLVRERRDVLPLRDSCADFVSQDSSLEFSEAVISGNPILARTLKPRAVIHRGQLAQAVFQDGALSITMKVEALEDGAPGQIIRTRNPVSRRDVSARVVNEQTLLISL
ncbi:MAG: flagellar basal body P-ring formation chaperone FlgA [Verrucomicrobiota bacterium]